MLLPEVSTTDVEIPIISSTRFLRFDGLLGPNFHRFPEHNSGKDAYVSAGSVYRNLYWPQKGEHLASFRNGSHYGRLEA